MHIASESSIILLTAAVLMLGPAATPAVSDSGTQTLFVPADPDPPGTVVRRTGRAPVTRLRCVTLNPKAVPTATSQVGDPVIFNLFEDVQLRGVLEAKVRDTADGSTWVGGIEGEMEGNFTWVMHQGAAVANIRSVVHGTFEVRACGGDRYHVRRVQEARYPACGNEAVHSEIPLRLGVRAALSGAAVGPRARSAGPTIIRVMVVYTPTSRQRLGGTAAADAEVVLAVTEANEAFLASGIDVHLELAHSQEVDYTELGAWTGWDLFMLTMGWGALQQVHLLRDAYRADLVTLLTDADDVCGQGWVPPWPASYFAFLGFSIVDWSCASGNFTYVHELGHNLGCLHDRENNDYFTFFPYGYGYRFTGTDAVLYRTVMAYAPGRRTQHFSNPDVQYAGVPTGVPLTGSAPCHNAKLINDGAPAAAAYFQ